MAEKRVENDNSLDPATNPVSQPVETIECPKDLTLEVEAKFDGYKFGQVDPQYDPNYDATTTHLNPSTEAENESDASVQEASGSDSSAWDPETEVINFLTGDCDAPGEEDFNENDYFSRLLAKRSDGDDTLDKWNSFHTVLFILFVILFSIFFVGVSSLSVFMVYLYANYHSEPCEQDLALWNLMAGLAASTSVTLYIVDFLCCPFFVRPSRIRGRRRRRRRGKATLPRFLASILFNCATNLLYLFQFIWLIVGTIWVVAVPEAHECPALVYNFTYYFVFINWAILGVLSLILVAYGLSVVVDTCLQPPKEVQKITDDLLVSETVVDGEPKLDICEP